MSSYVPLVRRPTANVTPAATKPRTPGRQSSYRGSVTESGSPSAGSTARQDRKPAVQPTVVLGRSGDAFERKADSFANSMSRTFGAGVSSESSKPPPPRNSLGPTTVGADAAPLQDVSRPRGGEALDGRIKGLLEAGIGRDLSHVRAHQDPSAQEMAAALNTRAFTHRNHIWLGRGESPRNLHLMAHEVAHVVQQEHAGPRVQCYEAGEHAQLGNNQDELRQKLYSKYPPVHYVVQPNDTIGSIAEKFGSTKTILILANRSKLTVRFSRSVFAFQVGESIEIPQLPNEMAEALFAGPAATFKTANGASLGYGTGIAMGDFFADPEYSAKVGGSEAASPEEVGRLSELIMHEQTGGKVTNKEWEDATTNNRYTELVEANTRHFAPPNKFVETGAATGENHKRAWEEHHRTALQLAQKGDKDKALQVNSFGDHFLTDAFAAGHLFNKEDLMAKVRKIFTKYKGRELAAEFVQFFDAVADMAFTGPTAAAFSRHETFDTIAGRHWDINSASKLSDLMQIALKERPAVIENSFVLAIHNHLNGLGNNLFIRLLGTEGGLSVKNAYGQRWPLSGDGTLNRQTMEVAKAAVAQSQMNLIDAYRTASDLQYTKLFKLVWDYTPIPDEKGSAHLKAVIDMFTDVSNVHLRRAFADIIQKEHEVILAKLVAEKKLRLIPE